jgi:hypothetical protein
MCPAPTPVVWTRVLRQRRGPPQCSQHLQMGDSDSRCMNTLSTYHKHATFCQALLVILIRQDAPARGTVNHSVLIYILDDDAYLYAEAGAIKTCSTVSGAVLHKFRASLKRREAPGKRRSGRCLNIEAGLHGEYQSIVRIIVPSECTTNTVSDF